jgi:hypothetical protein
MLWWRRGERHIVDPTETPDQEFARVDRQDRRIGHQKALVAPLMIQAVNLAAFWAAWKHGVEIPADRLLDIAGLLTAAVVWLTPHGR